MVDTGKILRKFYLNIHKENGDESDSGCWIWTGFRNRDGYGIIQVGKRRVGVHRWSYEHFKGPLHKSLVRHKCDNPPCCNPAHLEKGTHQQNSQDIIDRGRHANKNKTHCPYGHPLSGDNLRLNSTTGYRECIACSKSRGVSKPLIAIPIKFKID